MHVLIVEDDEATAAYVQKGLVEAGHTADIAVQGDEGLEKASGEKATQKPRKGKRSSRKSGKSSKGSSSSKSSSDWTGAAPVDF